MTTEHHYQLIIGRLEKAARKFLSEWRNDPENPDTYDAAADLESVLGVSSDSESSSTEGQ